MLFVSLSVDIRLISVFSFLKMFSLRVFKFTYNFFCHYIGFLFVQIRLKIFLSVFSKVFIGRKEDCIVLSDTGMQINNTETWKSVN